MKTVVAFQFDVQPRPGQSVPQCLDAVRDVVNQWLLWQLGSQGMSNVPLRFDGKRTDLDNEHQVLTKAYEVGDQRLLTWEWEFPLVTEPLMLWQFGCAVANDKTTVQIAMTVSQRWRAYFVTPLETGLTSPNPLCHITLLKDRILDGWNCRVEGHVIPNRIEMVRKENVERFFGWAFGGLERAFPVVLIFLDGRLKFEDKILPNVQMLLRGMASLAVMVDADASAAMRYLMNRDMRGVVPEHAISVFWAGRPARNHLVYPIEKVKEIAHLNLGSFLQTRILPVMVEQFREGSIIRGVRAALADRATASSVSTKREAALEAEQQRLRQALDTHQRDAEDNKRHVRALLDELAELRAEAKELRKARAVPPTTSVPPSEREAALVAEQQRLRQTIELHKQDAEATKRHVRALLDELTELRTEAKGLRNALAAQPAERNEELVKEVERSWDENKGLRRQLDEMRRQLQELETDFRNYLDASALFVSDDADEKPKERVADSELTATVTEALRQAAIDHHEVLVVWEDAEKSAKESSFGSPDKVYQALTAIAEVGEAYFQARKGGPPLGPIERAFRRRVPFKYTAFESNTTLNLFGAERVFSNHGKSRQMQRHLTLGGGTTNNCLQIYFDFDEENHRVLIGYCGRHLPYSRQRT